MFNRASWVRWLLIGRARVRKLEDRKAAVGCFGDEAKLVGGDPLSFALHQQVTRSQCFQTDVVWRHEDSQFAVTWSAKDTRLASRRYQRHFCVLIVTGSACRSQ